MSNIIVSPVSGIIEFNTGAPSGSAFHTSTAPIRLDATGGNTWITGSSVGIGTTAPAYPLDVTSSEWTQARFESTSDGYAPASILLEAGQSDARGQGIFYYNSVGDHNWFAGVPYSTTSDDWIISHRQGVGSFDTTTAQMGYAKFVVNDNGNVGIGTDSPSQKLYIYGSPDVVMSLDAANDAYLTFSKGGSYKWAIVNDYAGTDKLAFHDYASASNRMVLQSDGNVGIGLNSPVGRVHLAGDFDTSEVSGLYIQNTASVITVDQLSPIAFTTRSTGWGVKHAATIAAGNADAYDGGAYLKFSTSSIGQYSPTEHVRIDNVGNVGIGTTAPEAMLHISGSDDSASTTSFLVQNSGGVDMLWVDNDKEVNVKTSLFVRDESISHRKLGLWWGGVAGYDAGNEVSLMSVYTDADSTRILLCGPNADNYPSDSIQMQANRGLAIFSGNQSDNFPPQYELHVSGSVGGTGAGDRITLGGTPYLLSGDSPAETQTLQDVTTNGNTTTTSILSTGPHISGVTGLFSDKVGIGVAQPEANLHVAGDIVAEDISPYLTLMEVNNNAYFVTLRSDHNAGDTFTLYGYKGDYLKHIRTDDADEDTHTLRLGGALPRVDVWANNAQRLLIDEDGNVGIGTDAPSYTLDVNSSTTDQVARFKSTDANAFISIEDNYDSVYIGHSSGDNTMSLGFSDTMGSTSNLNISTAGNLGIGVAAPTYKLHVGGDISSSATIYASTQFQLVGGKYWTLLQGNKAGSNSDLLFYRGQDATTSMVIKSGGQVGIGTSEPDEMLHIYAGGASNLKLQSSSTSDTRLIFTNSARQWFTYQDSIGQYIIADNTAGKNRIEISTAGDVGIGAIPSGKLHVEGDIVISSGAVLKSVGSEAGYQELGFYAPPAGGGTVQVGLELNGQEFFEPRVGNHSFLYGFNTVKFKPTADCGKAGQVAVGFGDPADAYPETYLTLGNGSIYSDTSRNLKLEGYNGIKFTQIAGSPPPLGFWDDGGLGVLNDNPQYALDVSGDVGGTGAGDRITLNGIPYLLSGDAASALTLQDVCDNDNSTTTSILSTGPHISGVTGLFSHAVGIGTADPSYNLDLGTGAASTIRLVGEADGTAIRVGAGVAGGCDVTLLRVDGSTPEHDGESDSSAFGFSLRYMGSRAGYDNGLSIFADNAEAVSQVEALTIIQNGKVGIGSNSPTYTLDVVGEIYASSNLFGSTVYSNTIRDQAGGNVVIQDNGGNVGIGTDTPNGTLHVNSDLTRQLLFTNSSTGPSASDGTYMGANPSSANFSIINQEAGNLYLGTSNTDRLTIEAGGDVGIGTTNPTTKLNIVTDNDQDGGGVALLLHNATGDCLQEIYGANDNTAGGYASNRVGAGINLRNVDATAGNYSILGFQNAAGYSLGGIHGVCTIQGVTDVTEGKLEFWTRNATDNYNLAMTVDESGMVGIGTANPAAQLDVVGTGLFSERVGIGTTEPSAPLDVINDSSSDGIQLKDAGGGMIARLGADGANNARARFFNSSHSIVAEINGNTSNPTYFNAGDVGIGTDTPIAPLHVSGEYKNFTVDDIQTKNETFGTSALADFLIVDKDNSRTRAALQVQGNGGATEVLFAASNGRVGIGTTDPSGRLEIKGEGASDLLTLKTTDSSSNETFWIKDGGRVGVRYYPLVVNQKSTDTDCPSSTYMYVHHASSPFIIKSDGKVGIGTSVPAHPLHVNSTTTDEVARFQSTDRDAFISIADYKKTGYIGIDGDYEVLSLGFNTDMGSTSNVTIDANGWIGIGDVTPVSELNIVPATGSITFGGLNKKNANLDTTLGITDEAGDWVGTYHEQKSVLTTNGSPSMRGFWASQREGYAENGVTWSGPSLIGFYAEQHISTTSHRGTISNQYGFRASAGINSCGVGGTVTNAYGVYIELLNNDSDGTVTNSYGVYINDTDTAGASTHRYGIYSEGSATKNYFQGSVGIGTTSPANSSTLDVRGRISVRAASDGELQFGTSSTYTWMEAFDGSADRSPKLPITMNPWGGDVGIGTTAPTKVLDVRGATLLSGDVAVGAHLNVDYGNIDMKGNDLKGNASCKIEMYAADGFKLTNPNNAHGVDIVADDLCFYGGGLGYRKIITDAGDLSIDPVADLLLVENGGNVGIGTATPNAAYKLHVHGLAYATGAVIGNSYAGQSPPSNGLVVEGNVGIGYYAATNKLGVYGNASVGSSYQSSAAPSNGLIVEGNVGIGNSTPTTELDVSGAIKGGFSLSAKSADFTLGVGDNGGFINGTSASFDQITISSDLGADFNVAVMNTGANVVITGSSSMIINGTVDGGVTLASGYQPASIVRLATNTYAVFGNLS